jgi:hypothetical protein
MHRLAACTLIAILAVPAASAEKFDPQRLAEVVAPCLDDRTVIVAHLDLTRLDPDKVAARAAALAGIDGKELAPLAARVREKVVDPLTKAGARELFIVFSLADLFVGPITIVPLAEGADEKAIAKAVGYPDQPVAQRHGGALVVAQKKTWERLAGQEPVKYPELIDAFTAAGDGAAQVVVLLPPDTRRILEEMLPNLPPDLGGGPMKTYSRGLLWASLGLDAADGLAMRWTLASPNEESARALHDSLGRLLRALARLPSIRSAVADPDEVVPRLTPQVRGDRLVLTLKDKELGEVLRPLLARLPRAVSRQTSTNNLRQILVAMHLYLDSHGHFPTAASYDKQGRPLLSWRVHLLPYLGEDTLYKQFHLDEPWDSPHNKKFITKMPRVFDSTGDPRKAAAGLTTYLAPRGAATMFPGRQGLRIADVTDGTARTIFLVDADDSRAVPWTQPQDLDFDPTDPARGLSLRLGDGHLVGFVDASAHVLPKSMDKSTLKALFTRNGGEVVNYP